MNTIVLVWTVSGFAAAFIADAKGRSFLGWLLLGWGFGLLAVIGAVLVEDRRTDHEIGKCSECGAAVRADAEGCSACGVHFAAPPERRGELAS